MRSIKFIALIISILALLSSCSTTSGKEVDKKWSKRKAKVRFIWLDNENKKHYDNEVSIKIIDTLFKAGDTALIDEQRYIIVN